MVLDQQVLKLFYPYQRETSRGRKLVSNVDEFTRYVEDVSGVDDVYVSTYPVTKNVSTGEHDVISIDRVVFELDGKSSIHDSKLLYLWGLQNGFSPVAIASGRKGCHVHILSSPFDVVDADKAKALLTDISTHILYQALGKRKSWDDYDSIDWTIFGNISSLIRVPNTLRPPSNNSYCSFLPQDFINMSETEIFKYTKSPHVFDYSMSRSRSFLDLPINTDVEVVETASLIEPRDMPHFNNLFHPDDVITFLSNLLSKKRLVQITQTNPLHNVRILTTIELIDLGLHPKEILYLFSQLHWHDWNERISFNFITDIASRYYSGLYRIRRPTYTNN